MSGFWNKAVKILGCAVSIGQPKKGVEHTPGILKIERIENHIMQNSAWVDFVIQPRYAVEKLRRGPIRNLKELARINRQIYNSILQHADPRDFFLTIGGDHSIGSSTLTALNKVHRGNLAVIWIDAHGDFNTPVTSPSGNYHGMPLAHALGLFREPEHFDWGQVPLSIDSVAMIGIRDLDPEEKQLMDSSGLMYYTMEQVSKIGIQVVMAEIMKKIDPNNSKMIHISLDVDGFDPSLFPGTGTAVPGGLTLEDYSEILKVVRKTDNRFVSMDIVEGNFEIERQITLMNVKEIIKQTFN